MTLAQLKATLGQLNLHPSRKLGQNYLADPESAQWIVRQLAIQPGDSVIELGAGLGALSDHLADKARRLVLVEVDARAAAWLRERFCDRPHVEVVEMDALHYDFRPLFAEYPVRIIGNLPYSCGGALLRAFLMPPSPFAKAVFMLQKEVADRVNAVPRTKAYGAFTLLIQAYWHAASLQTIGPEAFYPQPKVDSSIIELLPRAPGELPAFDHRGFDRLLRQGFSQRRKQLRKLLENIRVDWEGATAALSLSPTARAEELSLEQWIALTNFVDDHPLKDLPQSGAEIFDVVDENDAVIGQAPRREVHERHLLHRAIHLFVFNAKGELFLQKRSHLKDAHPNTWDSSAAGHLDQGEDYDTAAVRELEEELGIKGVALEPLATIAPSAATGWEHVRLYRCEWRGAIRYPCSEIAHGAYFPLDVIQRWIAHRPEDFASGFIECFRAFSHSKGA